MSKKTDNRLLREPTKSVHRISHTHTRTHTHTNTHAALHNAIPWRQALRGKKALCILSFWVRKFSNTLKHSLTHTYKQTLRTHVPHARTALLFFCRFLSNKRFVASTVGLYAVLCCCFIYISSLFAVDPHTQKHTYTSCRTSAQAHTTGDVFGRLLQAVNIK